jgi:predicted helicase
MTAIQNLLKTLRQNSLSPREQGTYFEDLAIQYFKNEPFYQNLYSQVLSYSNWADEQNLAGQKIDRRDTGIDLVATTHGTNEFHAIQCKFYEETYRIQKSDIDSFFTASGKKQFSQRIIIATTNNWSEHAEDALQNQQPPVTKIDLNDLENSQIDWSKYQPNQQPILKKKKELRDHQKAALKSVEEGLAKAARGKLIMACGTGKTFTSLKIAEKLAGKNKRVLFLVPSLSLLSQTLTEWTQESATPLNSFAVCSDSDVGKKRKNEDDIVQTFTHELRYPATTNSARLAFEMQKRHDPHHMSVVFSTYHSIEVISKAQKNHGLEDFDLIICDEAHRTTGQTFDDKDESNFVQVHDANFIKSKKRLYMTATPRIYGNEAKAVAEKDKIAICSMDDKEIYGETFFTINFSQAVKQDLLVDYKVIVLAVDSQHVSDRLQHLLKDENNALKVDDAARIIGCWKALSKLDTQEDLTDDQNPMRRAVAFCQVIEPQNATSKTNKVSSKKISSMFAAVVEEYKKEETKSDEPATKLVCEAAHVDGSMNASQKEEKLNWLKEKFAENTCRILSNVRCLSEGVDVPALDAVLFLTPRNSQIDVVQSVGRVMRKAEGKKRGYVILPVVVPSGVEAHESLDKNQNYKVVWQVLNALRSHDDRFDALTNKLDLGVRDLSKMEVICITNKIGAKNQTQKPSENQQAQNSFGIGEAVKSSINQAIQTNFKFEVSEIERAIYAQVVKKCGNRSHWEDWANDISTIAKKHIERINSILSNPENSQEIKAFEDFLNELRDDLNNQITEGEAIEMLAQHLITKPVFDALFEGYSFAKNNPVSKAMQGVIEVLSQHHLQKEADTLQKFYDSVKQRAAGINDVAAKQKIIIELYDKFFKNAFPKMTERLGIVYTPIEVVDFIIHSVNDALKNEFGQSLGSENVHIIDPFTGTGTFITRLMQSGLISKEQLAHKYTHEIHANEIVLLAYYIAAINIESVYHDIMGGDYKPFNGICLTDTFALYEKGDMISDIFTDNSARRKRQKKLDLRVIIGNPPYSSGQKSENDNNANIEYEKLDESIRETYAKNSKATSTKNLMDSYIRSIRWASDRIKDAGVIGFVTNASFIDSNSSDGLRKCLAQEFSSIYIFHLRGNARTSGELRQKEGGGVFDFGSRAPIAITILVKNPKAKETGKIYFCDIGDYLSRQEKLEKISQLKSIEGILADNLWQEILPDSHGDWLNQRDESFANHISLGDKKNKNEVVIFENYSQGVLTSRDAWCYNFSKNCLAKNMQKTISFYNSEIARYKAACQGLLKENFPKIDDFVNNNPSKISWSSSLKNFLQRGEEVNFDSNLIITSLYRPFAKQTMYLDNKFIHRLSKIKNIFPTGAESNLVISITGSGTPKQFSVIISDKVIENQLQANGQCFPLKLFSPKKSQTNSPQNQDSSQLAKPVSQDEMFDLAPSKTADLFDEKTEGNFVAKDGITDAGLAHFSKNYAGEKISKEDVFYYIYGLLHSKDYKEKFADNLAKELPRIPCVKKFVDFLHFSKAGRELAELHINYENVSPFAANFAGGNLSIEMLKDADFKVEKMKFAKVGKETDKTKVIYNSKITVENIPLEAYSYVVNGKPAIEWVMERQGISTHKESGIVNDANLFAIETMNNARYPLDLLLRVITVSLETIKIVRALPRLEI